MNVPWYQEDPTNPHVNMRGKYSDVYRKTHPTAPEMVAGYGGLYYPLTFPHGCKLPTAFD